jgi:hypothetical protein
MSTQVIVLRSSDSEDDFVVVEPLRGTYLFRSLHLLFEDPDPCSVIRSSRVSSRVSSTASKSQAKT